jgi:kynurenine formamidase
VVLVRTGWGKFWGDAERYLGSAERGEGVELHFPGLSAAAAQILVERGVDLVGIDTASLDHGPSADFAAHRVLAEANVPGLENVAHLELLPEIGVTLLALPMKITGGTGGPVRIVAWLP